MRTVIAVLVGLVVLGADLSSQIVFRQTYLNRPAFAVTGVKLEREYTCAKVWDCTVASHGLGDELDKKLKAEWPSRILGPGMSLVFSEGKFKLTLRCQVQKVSSSLADWDAEVRSMFSWSPVESVAVRRASSFFERYTLSFGWLKNGTVPLGFRLQQTVRDSDSQYYSVATVFVVAQRK